MWGEAGEAQHRPKKMEFPFFLNLKIQNLLRIIRFLKFFKSKTFFMVFHCTDLTLRVEDNSNFSEYDKIAFFFKRKTTFSCWNKF